MWPGVESTCRGLHGSGWVCCVADVCWEGTSGIWDLQPPMHSQPRGSTAAAMGNVVSCSALGEAIVPRGVIVGGCAARVGNCVGWC